MGRRIENAASLSVEGNQSRLGRLQKDLRQMEEHFWIPQNRYKDDITHWDGIAVYSISGDARDLRCADRLPVRKSAAGEKCSYICNELLPQFGAPWLRVVFYRLRAGTQIGQHRDLAENRVTPGIIRIHVPVVTNDKVIMYVDDEPYYFPLGTAWYFDATAYHRVENNGDGDRIHLVFDLKLSPTFEKMLKPLTISDRFRFSYIAVLHYLGVARTFLDFVQTRDGRARIRARAAQVFHLSGPR
jgi:hypothetical protein